MSGADLRGLEARSALAGADDDRVDAGVQRRGRVSLAFDVYNVAYALLAVDGV